MVNLICDFIGQSVKSDSKSGKEREGERQLWRRRLTFSLIQIDSLFVQEGAGLNGNCFVSRKHRFQTRSTHLYLYGTYFLWQRLRTVKGNRDE